MTKVWISDYVSFDAEAQSDNDLPLLFCLRFAIDRGRPLDFFLNGILTGKGGPAGGDPGWSIHWIPQADEALFPEDWENCMSRLPPAELGCYEAWTHQPVSDLDPPCAYYPRQVVRQHVLEVLRNFRARHPARSAEVDLAIERFDLKNV